MGLCLRRAWASFGLAFTIFVLGVLGFIIGTCGYLICWSGMLMGAIGREAGVFLRDLADVAQELGTDAIGEVKSIKNRTQHEKQSLLEVQEKLRKETEDE